MGIREKLNQGSAKMVLGPLVGVLTLMAIWSVVAQCRTNAAIPTRAYYSIDDGQSYFADDINKLPPFVKDGKEAVKAFVFSCKGKPAFVAYLGKYDERSKSIIERCRKDLVDHPNVMPSDFAAANAAGENGWVFKKPGDKDWVRRGAGISPLVKCEDGSPAQALP